MRLLVTREIWTEGRVSITKPPPIGDWFIQSPDGRWVAPYGIGQSLAFIPFDIAGAALERLAPDGLREYVGWLPIGFGFLPLIGVLWWWALRGLVSEYGVEAPWPTVAATLVVLCTIAFHYIGLPQEEVLVGLLLAVGCRAALRAGQTSRRGPAIVAGFCAGLCLITRPISIFGLAVLPLGLLAGALTSSPGRGAAPVRVTGLRLLRPLIWMAAVSACVATIELVYNQIRFGSVLSIGYDRLGHMSRMTWDSRSPGVLVSLLLGPGAGFLVLSPILWVAAAGFATRDRRDRLFVWGSGLAALAAFAFFSGWHDSYTGGATWGTRYEVHLLSLLAVPLALGAQSLWRKRAWRPALIILVVVSGAIQVMSTVLPGAFEDIQGRCTGKNRLLLSGVSDGLLVMRARNVVHMVRREKPSWDGGPSCAELPRLEQMWSHYTPNYWGPVYVRRFDSMTAALLAGWGLTAGAGLALLAIGLVRTPGIASVRSR